MKTSRLWEPQEAAQPPSTMSCQSPARSLRPVQRHRCAQRAEPERLPAEQQTWDPATLGSWWP